MKCPIDGAELVMSERHGVEIDYCPKCRGVWLDRGELDKIIDKAVPPLSQPEPAPPVQEYREPERRPAPQLERKHGAEAREWREPYRKYEDDDDREYDRGRRYSKKKRRKSFLEEIFDFD